LKDRGGAAGTDTPDIVAHGQTQALGAALFTDYLPPFELAVLLLVGMVGLWCSGRGAMIGQADQKSDTQTLRSDLST
jgi:hypothetical protein